MTIDADATVVGLSASYGCNYDARGHLDLRLSGCAGDMEAEMKLTQREAESLLLYAESLIRARVKGDEA